MSFLVFTPVLKRTSRTTFNYLARFMASCCGAPAWITAATQMSGPFIGRALRWSTLWGLSNHVLRLIPPTKTLPIFPKLLRGLLAYADQNDASTVAGAMAGLYKIKDAVDPSSLARAPPDFHRSQFHSSQPWFQK